MKIGIDFDGVAQEKCFDWSIEEQTNFYKKYFILASKTAPFITGAKDILRKLKEEGHELYIISNRGIRDYADETVFALDRLKEIGIQFDGFAWDNKNKAETCKKLGVEMMIDDSPTNAKDFIGTDIKVLFFRDVKIERVFADNIKRVDTWQDIYFEANNIEYK